jgi:hypothetical protein
MPKQALVALIEEDRGSMLQACEDRRIALKAQEHRVNTTCPQRLSLTVDVIPLVARKPFIEIMGSLRSLLTKLTG